MANNVGDSSEPTFMIACPDCGKLIPRANLELHRLRACRGSNHGINNNNNNNNNGSSSSSAQTGNDRNRGARTTLPATTLRTTTSIAHHEERQGQGQGQEDDDDSPVVVTAPGNSPFRRPRKTRRGNLSGGNQESVMRSSLPLPSSPEERAGSTVAHQNSRGETREIIDLLDDPESLSASDSFDPMDISNSSVESTGNSAMAVDLTGNDGDDEVVEVEDDRKPPARDTSNRGTPGENGPNNGTTTSDDEDEDDDESDDENDEDDDNRKLPARENGNNNRGTQQNDGISDGDQEWSCPRCTLLNQMTSAVCDACHYRNKELQNKLENSRNGPNRAAAERSPYHRSQRPPASSTPSSHLEYIGTGALLGAAVGMGGNWLMGRDPLSGAVNGGSTGAVGGALLHEVLLSSNNNNTTNNNRRRALNASIAAMGAEVTARNNDIIDITSTLHSQSATELGSSLATARSSSAAGFAVFSPEGNARNRNASTNANANANASANTNANASANARTSEFANAGRTYRQRPRASYRSITSIDENGNQVTVITGGNSTTRITRSQSATGSADRHPPIERRPYAAQRRSSDGLMDLMLHHQLQMDANRGSFRPTSRSDYSDRNRNHLSREDALRRLQQALNPHGRFQGQGGGGVDVDRMNYDQLLRVFGDGTENMGATESEIHRLPSHTVGENPLPEDARQCLICLEDFEEGETRTILPCLHGFHQNCCHKWLKTNGSCPVCKHRIG